jgi:hypothetical protein
VIEGFQGARHSQTEQVAADPLDRGIGGNSPVMARLPRPSGGERLRHKMPGDAVPRPRPDDAADGTVQMGLPTNGQLKNWRGGKPADGCVRDPECTFDT